MLLELRVLALEDLAQANEDLLQRIGMGARSLKQRAIDWLQAKSDHGPLVTKVDALQQALTGMEERVKNLTAVNEELQRQLLSRAVHSESPPVRSMPVPDDDSVFNAIDKTIDQALGN
jgi:vacuolar-type H+-ATPase subunit E/Vma4